MNHLDIQRIPRSQTEPTFDRSSNGSHSNVDITALLTGSDSDERTTSPPWQSRSAPAPPPPQQQQQQAITPPPQASSFQKQAHVSRPIAPASRPGPRRSTPATGPDQPAKKQSKWSADEDTIIIELRGKGMKWEDISRNLPGRSAISCRLHYQNYLERRSEWDEGRKDKLAQLYERFKNKMWAELAEELQVPWRAAEAMHWQLGEAGMAKRAGTTPFTLAAVNADMNAANRRRSPSRSQLSQSHAHLQSQRHGSVPTDMGAPTPRTLYARSHAPPSGRPEPQLMTPRRDTVPPPPRAAEPSDMVYVPGPTIAPLQYQEQPEGGAGHQLPSIAELTTGMNPYHAPYAGPPPPRPTYDHGFEHHLRGPVEPVRIKRPASPEESYGETSTRRRMD